MRERGGFVSVHFCNRHQGDRITNRTFWKLSVSTGAKWGLSAINKTVRQQGDILEKSKALVGTAIISPLLLESDKEAEPCRRGCWAPGQLDLTAIPPSGKRAKPQAFSTYLVLVWYCTFGRTAEGIDLLKRGKTNNPCSWGENMHILSNPSSRPPLDEGFYLVLDLHDLREVKAPWFGFDNVSEPAQVCVAD